MRPTSATAKQFVLLGIVPAVVHKRGRKETIGAREGVLLYLCIVTQPIIGC